MMRMVYDANVDVWRWWIIVSTLYGAENKMHAREKQRLYNEPLSVQYTYPNHLTKDKSSNAVYYQCINLSLYSSITVSIYQHINIAMYQ